MPTIFRLLPDHLRDADNGDLASFLNGVEDALSLQTAFLDAASAGEPVNPATCPAAWLPSLARLLGADITGLTDTQARWYLCLPERGATGSDQGLTNVVAATLTGTRYVRLDHTGEWTITLTIATGDIVDIAVTQAVAQRAAAAGFDVTVSPSDPVTLADLDAAYASLAAIYATGKTLDQLRFG